MHVESLADRSTLSLIRKQIRSELNANGAPEDLAFDCLVAVTEACTNAIVHGAGDGSSQVPEISWSIDAARALFYIKDYSNKEGAGPSLPESDPEPSGGGYGLAMMRELMDDVEIKFSPQGTTVILEKRFRP